MSNNNKTKDQNQEVSSKPKVSGLFTVVLPNTLNEHELNNFLILIRRKRILFMHALGVKDVPVDCTDSELSFPWFRLENIDGEAEAYTYFIEALIDHAKRMKKIPDEIIAEENEKYLMHRFIVQLGLNGDKFKLTRKLFTKRLAGSAAWPNGRSVRSRT